MLFLKPIHPLLTSLYQVRIRIQPYQKHYQIRRSTIASSTHTSPKLSSRRYIPYLYDILLSTFLGSEALHLLWLKQEYAEYRERTELRIEVLQRMVEKLERGDQLNEDIEKVRDVLDDETELEKLIMSLALEPTPKKEDTSIQSNPDASSGSSKKPLYL